jgi:hypothetical protein
MAYRGTSLKMTTAEYRSRLRSVKSGGTQYAVTLAALGITHEDQVHGVSELLAIISAHRVTEPIDLTQLALPEFPVTLAVIMRYAADTQHLPGMSGDIVVITGYQVIVMSNGEITDSTGDTATVKRRVTAAYRVKPVHDQSSAESTRGIITWLRSPAGEQWSRGMHRQVQHSAGVSSRIAFARLKPLSDTGTSMHWDRDYACTGGIESWRGPEYTGAVKVTVKRRSAS